MRRTLNDRQKLKRPADARLVIARGLVTRALRSAGLYHVLDRSASLTVISGVKPDNAAAIEAGLTELTRVHGWGAGYGRGVVHNWTGSNVESRRRRDGSAFLESCGGGDPEFVLVESASAIPDKLGASCDGIAAIGTVDAVLVGAAFSVVLGGRPKPPELERAAGLPIADLSLAIRKGRPVREAMATIDRLLALVAQDEEGDGDEAPAGSTGPTLDDLHGLGEAGVWGRLLVADLADYREGRLSWHDLDRGALLVGPPGVGKTMFASALAASAGLPLHAHSFGTWQARGHLGDMLKALKRAFADARSAAPCVMFIDEIDAAGSRTDPRDQYPAYSRQVIAAILEELDGTVARDGIVVVGATNHPEFIDPAILRPGRLDRLISIPLPDAAGRVGILRHHLRGALVGTDLRDVAEATTGFSGADLERLVRDGRRAARTGRRAIAVADLLSALPPAVILSDSAFRRACVHEAGHWVVGLELAIAAASKPTLAAVSRRVSEGFAGKTEFRRDPGADRTRASTLAEISILLAGAAAEDVVLGVRGHGSGGGAGSDLHLATTLAAKLELSYGLGAGLAHVLESDREDRVADLLRDPEFRDRVETVLAGCLDRARSIVLKRRPEVEEAARLLSSGRPVTEANCCQRCQRAIGLAPEPGQPFGSSPCPGSGK